MADTFHMNIEESDGIPNAIRRAGGDYLKHFHVADNTREPPALGAGLRYLRMLDRMVVGELEC